MTKKYMYERLQDIKKKYKGLDVNSAHQSYRIIEMILKEWNDDIKKAYINQLNQDYKHLFEKGEKCVYCGHILKNNGIVMECKNCNTAFEIELDDIRVI